MSAVLRLRACAVRLPLASASVHAVVTSPPYYGLRKYAGVPDSVWGGDPAHAHEWGTPLSPIKAGQVAQTKWQAAPAVADGQRANTGAFCACESWRGTLGNEPTVALYVEHMVEVFREVRRVLRNDGVLWLNIGDSFHAGGRVGHGTRIGAKQGTNRASAAGEDNARASPEGVEPGNLLGVPWRVALALQADGWIVREDVIWAKRAPMPESVAGWRWERHRQKVRGGERSERLALTVARANSAQQDHDGHGFAQSAMLAGCPGCDKCEAGGGYVLRRGSWRHTRSHEYLFLLAKSADYYGDGEAVAEPAMMTTGGRLTAALNGGAGKRVERPEGTSRDGRGLDTSGVDGRRNPRSVLHLGPEPLAEPHYAAFPTALVEPLIASSTSARGVCAACGAPWARVLSRQRMLDGEPPIRSADLAGPDAAQGFGHWRVSVESRTLGWRPTCACGARAVPATVLDPFAGSGTTGAVAVRLGRRAILCDLSATYLRDIAARRTRVQPPLAGEWFA